MLTENILSWTHNVLKTTPDRWMDLTSDLPAGLLTRPPAPGEWSALECLQHLVDTERLVFPVRVRYLLAEQDFPAFDPDAQGTISQPVSSALQVAEEFSQLRHESLSLLDQVNASDLEKKARHQELGIVTLSELLHEWVGHDLMHTLQAERALMQPFIAGCGPWKIYFADHAISEY